MNRKKIIWLVSWYPNKNDIFDGDFIQRQARAAAIHHDVHVIFVTTADIENAIEEEWSYATGLTEQIIYIKKATGFLSRLRKHWNWRTVFQKAIKKYIEKNGMPDHVHVHVPWKAGLLALWMKKKYRTEFIVTEHWAIYKENVPDSFTDKSLLVRKGFQRIYEQCRGVVPVSNDLGKSLSRLFSVRVLSVINNVVDTTLFHFSEKKYSAFSFIHVSNISPRKNVKGIIDAFKIFLEKNKGSNAQLIIAGNKNNKYAKYAGESGLLHTSVFFRGEISYREVADEMQRSHCFVLNSLMENSPCVIGEALCCGLPVIATNVGGVSELVNENNSRLIPANDTMALATAMEEVWKNYSDYPAQQIADDASKRFGYGPIAESFRVLYNKPD